MTTTHGSAERRMTAFLDGIDSPTIANPIHSTEVAKQYGYRAALVGGVTVYGWATPTILDARGERWLDGGWIEVAFRHPTYPGDELTISVAPDGDGASMLRMTKADGSDAVTGTLGLGEAPWLGEFRSPQRRVAEPRPERLPQLTMAIAPSGADIRPMAVSASADEMRTYALEKQRSADPRFVGEQPLIHPGWIAARMTPLLHHSYDYGPSIHSRSHIQHLAPAESGQTVTVAGHFVETYERKGHQYAVVDGVLLAEDGRELARLRHTTIFNVAKRPASVRPE